MLKNNFNNFLAKTWKFYFSAAQKSISGKMLRPVNCKLRQTLMIGSKDLQSVDWGENIGDHIGHSYLHMWNSYVHLDFSVHLGTNTTKTIVQL